MKLTVYIGLIAWLLPLLVPAQTNGSVEEAYLYYTNEDFSAAAEVIDQVVEDVRGRKSAVAWHLRGFIYKDLYLNSSDSAEARDFRDYAVESFQKSISLDTEEEFWGQNAKALKFLAVTYYNDASDIIGVHDPQKIALADECFFAYVNLMEYIHPDTTLTQKKIDYYLAMSTAYRKIYESDRELYDAYWQKSNEMFRKVLELDPESFKANYSLAVSHYNKGAYNLRKLSKQEDLHDIFAIQAQSMRSIEIALPLMLKAYKIDPDRIETVHGLKIIYFNLNKEQESREFDERERQLKIPK